MNELESIHNTHLESANEFQQTDPHLRRLANLPLQFEPALLHELPIKTPGIYTLGGGRQIGKTTLLKLWMKSLLQKKVKPSNILFLTGELIPTYENLIHRIKSLVDSTNGMLYIIVDEVTYINHWPKAIKFVADAGLLEQAVLMLSGSDLSFLKEARMTFPGRRGQADVVDFHLYPLSFAETVALKSKKEKPDLMVLFEEYLLHGGYLTAINDYERFQEINSATYATYADWIRGDVIRRGKNEVYLREVIEAVCKRYGSQVTWNGLSHDMSIQHPSTLIDYVSLLESMDALTIQSALLEDKLVAAPKKAKKIYFNDPFILRAMLFWLNGNVEFDSSLVPALVEGVVVSQFSREYLTFYIKAEGEVDIAYIDQRRFWPVEVKWTNQLRAKDLKQISKYKNAIILSKLDRDLVSGIKNYFLPEYLLNRKTNPEQ